MYRAKSKNIKLTTDLIKLLAPIEVSNDFHCVFENEAVIFETSYMDLPPKLEGNAINGVKIDDLNLTGELHPIDWKTITHVFTELENNVGITGRVSISIRFEEPESELSNDGNTSVNIIKEDGKYFFGYSANGTRVCLDCDYAIEVFENLFKVMELPLILTKTEKGFDLKHTNGLKVKVSGISLTRPPATFFCELSNIDAIGLIEKLKFFVENCIDSKILDVDWAAGKSSQYKGDDPRTDEIIDIYNTVIDLDLPAIKYEMCPYIELKNLNGIEAIRALCAEKNIVTVRYGAMSFGDLRVMVSISVSADGYHIEAATRSQSAIDKLFSMLKLDFEKN